MYSGSFSATLAKIRGANRPPNFLDQKTFFAALFELFCRSFGNRACPTDGHNLSCAPDEGYSSTDLFKQKCPRKGFTTRKSKCVFWERFK